MLMLMLMLIVVLGTVLPVAAASLLLVAVAAVAAAAAFSFVLVSPVRFQAPAAVSRLVVREPAAGCSCGALAEWVVVEALREKAGRVVRTRIGEGGMVVRVRITQDQFGVGARTGLGRRYLLSSFYPTNLTYNSDRPQKRLSREGSVM